jgi:O-antigen/teichoic acid export membrane protein
MTRLAFLRGERAVDTAWALVDQGTTLVASTLSFLLLGRNLGAGGYGAFFGIYALMGPLLAFSQAGVFLTAMEHTVRWREDPNDVARSCLSITLTTAVVSIPIMTGIALSSIDGIPALTVVLLVGAEFLLNGVMFACVGLVQAVRGFSAAARLRMTGALSKITLLIVLAGMGSLTLNSLAIGQVVTLSAVMVFSLVRVGQLPGIEVRPGRIRRKHVRSTFLYGLGLAASSAQSDGDKFVLNAAHFQADAGRYGAAYRLVQITMLPIQALVNATHLSFLDVREQSDNQVHRATRLSLASLVYAVPAMMALFIIAPWVPKILTRDFAATVRILRWLTPLVILRGMGAFPLNGLLGLGRNDLRTRLLVVNALLSLVLYAALIPTHSWMGALVATLISESSLFASGWAALFFYGRRQRRDAGGTAIGGQARVDRGVDEL